MNEWQIKWEAKRAQIKAEVRELMDTKPREELEKRFLRNFGCINFISEEAQHELDLAREFHRQLMIASSSKHFIMESEPHRCYHVKKCTCGFREECDSSD